MKVLVTGGTGFVGSHTAVALADTGHQVRLLVRSREKAKAVFEALGATLPECVPGDVTDPGSVVAALEGCEGVLHAAALVALDARQGAAVDRTNFEGTRNVVGEAHRRGLGHIVYVSSVSALFDPEAGTIHRDSKPTALAGSVYSASKARTESWIRELQAAGAPVAATYPGGVLGPFAPNLSDLHRSLPLQLRTALLTDGGVNLVDVRDLARVHAALFARPAAVGRWIAGGPFIAWTEFADILCEVTGRRIPRVRTPGALLRALGWAGDVVKRVVPFSFPLTYEAMTTATRWPGVDSEPTLRELGLAFRAPRETFADTLRWMHRAGHLPASHVGRLAEP